VGLSACPTDQVILDKLLDELSSSLPPDQVAVCEGYVSTQEVYKALVGMATGKSPGSDGLPAEFYVAFCDVLGADLVEVLNASLDSRSPSLLQRSAIIF